MTHPFLIVWLLLMIRYEFVYVYFIATKNVGATYIKGTGCLGIKVIVYNRIY